MIQIKVRIEQFGQQGEKTGWTYFLIPNEIANQLNPGMKKSYRVKGFIDQVPIAGIAIIPMGGGDFIMPLNAMLRKKIGKKKNDHLVVKLAIDTSIYLLNEAMMECLKDEPEAYQIFMSFPRSHQNYYSKWVDSAKTANTQAKRIAQIIEAMYLKQTFAEMLKSDKQSR